MKEVASKIQALSMSEIQSILDGATLYIDYAAGSLELTEESIQVQRKEKENVRVLNEGSLTVGLETEITEELRREGTVRDLVRSIQNMRKDSGLEVTDRIRLALHGSEDVRMAVESFEEHLLSETLAVDYEWREPEEPVKVECGDTVCSVGLSKA